MSVTIRQASPGDLPQMIPLLVTDAEQRHARDPLFWAMAEKPSDRLERMLKAALMPADSTLRQQWLVAETDGRLLGLAHSVLVPVPPIYAGSQGPPGLLLEDCVVAEDAPPATHRQLIEAAERDLQEAGAKILLASSVSDGPLEAHYSEAGYVPLTLYLSKSGLGGWEGVAKVRPATADDVPGIVEQSARHRSVLAKLDRFWEPHAEADERFRNWMRRSLTLADRDMLVSVSAGRVDGYIIAQPATALHFPSAHDIRAVGVIDDYFHAAYADSSALSDEHQGAVDLLRQAEAAFCRRGIQAAMVVCPAAWRSKRAGLEMNGYTSAIKWLIKR